MLRNILRDETAKPRRRRSVPVGQRLPRHRTCRLEQCEQRLLLTFHLWKIDQVFSSSDGKAQFIELSDPSNGENRLTGHAISSNENKFTFPADLPTDATANHHFLIGTASYAALPGAVKPDYIIPDNFFNPQGDSFNYADVDSMSFMAGQEPTDGVKSLFRDVNSGNLTTGPNSETNLAGQSGSVTASATMPPTTTPPTTTPPTTTPPTTTPPTTTPPTTVPPTNSPPTVASSAQDQVFVRHLYEDLLNRDPVGGESQPWLSQLASGADRTEVAQAILESPEHLQVLVKSMYQTMLGRTAETQGLNFWTNMLAHGSDESTVRADIASSDEFFNRAGGTNDGFLAALYQDLLGRAGDAPSIALWQSQLAGNATRRDVAEGFVKSSEFHNLLVNDPHSSSAMSGWYQTYFHRAADQAGQSFFAGQLDGKTSLEKVQLEMLASDEYFARA